MKGFNKKIYITILTIATVVLVLLGIVIHVMIPMINHKFSFGVRGNRITEEYDVPSDIHNITFDGDAIELIIRADSSVDSIECTYNGQEELLPDMSVSDDTIAFSQNVTRNVGFGNIESPELTILVNPELEFENIFITVNAGDVEITNISVESLKGDFDAGNIEIFDTTIDSFVVDTDAGNVEVTGGSINSSNVSCDAGNIEFVNVDLANFDGSCDMGNIEIRGINTSDYSIDAEVDMGDITVNGASQGGNYHSGNADNTITVEVSMGAITIAG